MSEKAAQEPVDDQAVMQGYAQYLLQNRRTPAYLWPGWVQEITEWAHGQKDDLSEQTRRIAQNFLFGAELAP